MVFGSRNNLDDIENKEPADSLRQRNAAATKPRPLAPRSEIIEEEVHGPPKAGGQNPSAATGTAAAAEQKIESLFWSAWGSPGGKPPPSKPPPPAGGKPPPSKPPPPAGGKPHLPAGGKPLLPAGRRLSLPAGRKPLLPVRPPSVLRTRGPSYAESLIDLKDVFDELMLECQKEWSRETDQKAEAEAMPKQQNEQALCPKEDKKPLWTKFLGRKEISNQKHTLPQVSYQKVHATELIRHYNLLEMVAGRGVEFHSNALNLPRAYSEFRPVHGDGECFYRSFIFSYLEQVLDRQDTHEEYRVLSAVKGVARQHARLGWASEFPRSHKAFKKLIKKVMRWKTHSRLKHVPTLNSYRIEKLLEFFNDNKRTNDIFTFLRFVAAIWICSHSEEFVPLILELNKGYTITEWCFQEVIQRKVFADHIQITALLRALRVPLRVEYLFQEAGQDLYVGQDSQDDMPRSTPPGHEVPRVTLLYTEEHYDIIYPYHPDGPVTSGESSGQRSDKIESQIASSSGETSNQQIDRVEGSTSSGEKSDKHTAEGGS